MSNIVHRRALINLTSRPALRSLVVAAIAFSAMLILAAAGIWLTREAGRIASIWVANAAIVSILLTQARELRVAILVSALLGNICANTLMGDAATIAMALSLCNLIEIVLVSVILQRLRPNVDFTALADLVPFAIVAGFIAPAVSAILAAIFLYTVNTAPFLYVLETWFASDALGQLVFVPLFATLAEKGLTKDGVEPLLRPQAMGWLLFNAAVAVLIFAQDAMPLLYLGIPAVMLVAFRIGTTGAVIANLTMTVVAIGLTLAGHGPVQLMQAGLSEKMATLQGFLAICVFVSLSISAYLADRRRLEARLVSTVSKLEQAHEAKSLFLSTVSHELRTPLTSIRGSLGLVNAGVTGQLPDKSANLIRIAHSNSERLVRLINDILDMEKIESGKMDFDIRPVALREIVQSAIETANNYELEKQVKILLIDEAANAVVHADADRLHQAMTNLLSNAIKFSPRQGVVRLLLETTGDLAKISITDEGRGIPQAFRKRIFGKFEQADDTSTRQNNGTGLGLSITKSLVEQMSGTIDFVSSEGLGTTFTLSLPSAFRPSHQEAGAPATRNRAVLACVIDGAIATLLHRQLLEEGYSNDQAPDMGSARLLLGSRRYEAVIIDVDILGDQIIEFFDELRSSAQNADIPVTIISASVGKSKDILNGHAVGVIDWLAKPVDPAHLRHSLAGLIGAQGPCRPRILHVEDDNDVVQVVAAGLGQDVDMVFAKNLSEARAALLEGDFDLVILDIVLPDGDGLDLLKELGTETKVIVFSAIDGNLTAPVHTILTKTRKSEADLAVCVRSLLAGKDAGQRRKGAR